MVKVVTKEIGRSLRGCCDILANGRMCNIVGFYGSILDGIEKKDFERSSM